MAAILPPILTTERLTLEPMSLAHSAGMFAMWSRSEVCLHSGPANDFQGRPITLPARSPADSDQIIDFFVRSAAAGLRFRWALIDRASGDFVGAVGLNGLGGCSEYAYHQRPEFWGKGLVSEASRAAFDWLRGRGDCRQVEVFIEPGNVASINLAARLGFAPTGEASDGADRYVMSLGELSAPGA